jgi:hypothetical protein
MTGPRDLILPSILLVGRDVAVDERAWGRSVPCSGSKRARTTRHKIVRAGLLQQAIELAPILDGLGSIAIAAQDLCGWSRHCTLPKHDVCRTFLRLSI